MVPFKTLVKRTMVCLTSARKISLSMINFLWQIMVLQCTLPPISAVWAWQGRNLKLKKCGHLFLCPWHFVYQFSTISKKMGLREKLSNKNFHFYCSKKRKFLCESFSRNPILLEIVEFWYTKCQGHKKRWPHFSSLMVRPCHTQTACI